MIVSKKKLILFCGNNESDDSYALFLRFLKATTHLLCNNSAILRFIIIVSSHFLITFTLFYIAVYHKSTSLCVGELKERLRYSEYEEGDGDLNTYLKEMPIRTNDNSLERRSFEIRKNIER